MMRMTYRQLNRIGDHIEKRQIFLKWNSWLRLGDYRETTLYSLWLFLLDVLRARVYVYECWWLILSSLCRCVLSTRVELRRFVSQLAFVSTSLISAPSNSRHVGRSLFRHSVTHRSSFRLQGIKWLPYIRRWRPSGSISDSHFEFVAKNVFNAGMSLRKCKMFIIVMILVFCTYVLFTKV